MGGGSGLEFEKLYQNLKKNFKNSIGLLRYLNLWQNFHITGNRNLIFQCLISLERSILTSPFNISGGGGGSGLEFDKLYQNMKKNFKNSIGL